MKTLKDDAPFAHLGNTCKSTHSLGQSTEMRARASQLGWIHSDGLAMSTGEGPNQPHSKHYSRSKQPAFPGPFPVLAKQQEGPRDAWEQGHLAKLGPLATKPHEGTAQKRQVPGMAAGRVTRGMEEGYGPSCGPGLWWSLSYYG